MIHFKFVGIKDMHNIYYLGLSGERSLPFGLLVRYVRNRINHWCTLEPGSPNPRVHRSSGKLGEAFFPTGTVDPWVGISLSPLNTNDGFSLSM